MRLHSRCLSKLNHVRESDDSRTATPDPRIVTLQLRSVCNDSKLALTDRGKKTISFTNGQGYAVLSRRFGR